MAQESEHSRPHADERGVRFASLQDYLRVIKRRRILIAVIVFIAGGLALAGSLSREKSYEATSQVLFRDVIQDIRLINPSQAALPELPPAQRSAINAEQVTGEEVASRALKVLGDEVALSVDDLQRVVQAQVGVQTGLVSIVASSNDPDRAAAIANAFATASQDVVPRESNARLKQVEQSIQDDLVEAREDEATLPGQVGVLELQLGQIRNLREIAEPVDVVEAAEPPDGPVSPDPVRDTTLGVIFGLVAGLIAAFSREALDRRLRTPKEVHDELAMPVLGRVRSSTFGRAGTIESASPPLLETDFESFRVLRTNLAFAASNGSAPRSVLVTSPLPEEGKSTVSMSLASAAALAGQRVLLVEADLRRPCFAKRMKLKPTPGLVEYLQGNAKPQEILQTLNVAPPRSIAEAAEVPAPIKPMSKGKSGPQAQVVVIPAGNPVTTGAELLASTRFRDFTEKVMRAYDLVIFDGSPLLAVVDPLELVPLVDVVLVCARVEQTTRDQAAAARSALDHLPTKPKGAVVTGIKPGEAEYYDYYYGY